MAWPGKKDIFDPAGAGPGVLVRLARDKIATTLQREIGEHGSVEVGLLSRKPNSPETDPPIAVVCKFVRPMSEQLQAKAHSLAWMFARSPLLITIEPNIVRTWTCCETPYDDRQQLFSAAAEIEEARLDLRNHLSPSQQAAHALHWVRLATGDFFRRFPDRFRRDGRADRVLLQQLTFVRQRLKRQGLDDDTIHDLLARIVFAQFLFDRKDADGRAALNPSLLAKLHHDGILTREHGSLGSILADYDEAYRFFRWLNDKFNGDLFPGKGDTDSQRESEWREELERAKPKHLETLANFVSGRVIGKQRTLWPLYSFDVIPLEFISSIYEEFVTSAGAHYTPGFLVDFMLDEVLPWDGTDWKLKILDPACGSGIFLVKAYQRLIQRWKNANPGENPPTALLRSLLERNLRGVDLDPHAVRVASFSLYLTMCDEIDPKSYLNKTKFPRLRGRSLIYADFFSEEQEGFQTEKDKGTYDRVVGNAPWGENTETKAARDWADHLDHEWRIVDKAIGTLFLPKAAALTKPRGRVCMIQPAGSLLFNRSPTASRFRKQLFSEFQVEEVVNLSTLRSDLFENATSPPCIVTLRPTAPDGQPLLYISPKQIDRADAEKIGESSFAIVVEPHDLSRIWPDEAATDPNVWTALAWGGRRDLALIRRLSLFNNLAKYQKRHIVKSREGVIRGDRGKPQAAILECPLLETEDFPASTALFLRANLLPLNLDPLTDSKASTSFQAFQLPQLIIKQGWTVDSARFKAAVVLGAPGGKGVICSQSYISVHAEPENHAVLESAALSYNSVLAVYFLLLTSGRLASYRPEPLVGEMRSVPIAETNSSPLEGIRTHSDIDARVRELFEFKDADWTLVQDLVDYTLPDFKGDRTSPGRQRTVCKPALKAVGGREPQLAEYCQYFIRVLKAGFGDDKAVCATIYQDGSDAQTPVRLVAIHLDWDRDDEVAVADIDSAELTQRLLELNEKFLQANPAGDGGIFFQRVARIYDEIRHGRRSIPTIFIVKPDRIRYWTRSAALRDADEVASDLQHWNKPDFVRKTERKK
jgi:hypothetical protein